MKNKVPISLSLSFALSLFFSLETIGQLGTGAATESATTKEKRPETRDVTPYESLNTNPLEWMKKIRVEGNMTSAPSETYFVQLSAPKNGSLMMNDGRLLQGQMQVQMKFNKSEQDVFFEKFILMKDGKRKVYSAWDVNYFYFAFSPSDLNNKRTSIKEDNTTSSGNSKEASEMFSSGKLFLNNAEQIDGMICFDFNQPAYSLPNYHRAYITNGSAPVVHIYFAEDIIRAEKMINGTLHHYDRILHGIMDKEDLIANVESGKVKGFLEPAQATIVLDDDREFKGQVMLDKGRKVESFLFVSEDKKYVNIFDQSSKIQIAELLTTKDGQEVSYTSNGSGFATMEEVRDQLIKNSSKRSSDEKNALTPGSITLNNGNVLKGQVAQIEPRKVYSDWNSELKTHGGLFYLNEQNKLRMLTFGKVKEFTQNLSNSNTHFVVRKYNDGSIQLLNSAELEKVMADGEVVFEDGTTKRVKVAAPAYHEVMVINEANVLEILHVSKVKSISANYPDGLKVWLGAFPEVNYFVEVHSPDKVVSFYKNPLPTHCNESATNLANSLKDVGAAAKAQYTAAQITADDKISTEQKKQKIAQTYENYESASSFPNCSVYYDEYIIAIKGTNKKYLIYKDNIDEMVSSLVIGCEDMNRWYKQVRKYNSVRVIEEFVNFLNENNCAQDAFVLRESTPLEKFVWSGLLKKGDRSRWTKGWVQTVGGKIVEGDISVFRTRTDDQGVIRKRYRKEFATAGVEIALYDKRELATLIYKFNLPPYAVLAVGFDEKADSINNQFETYDSLEAYEPDFEEFLLEQPKIVQPNGSIFTMDNIETKGNITLNIRPLLWFAESAFFEDESGTRIELTSNSNLKMIQIDNGNEIKSYVPYKDVFVEILVDSKGFRYFRNPYPTAEVGVLSGLAATLSAAQQEAAKQGSRDRTEFNADDYKKLRKEYVFLNLDTGEAIIVHSGIYKKMVNSFLAICPKFESLDSKQQALYLDDNSPEKTIQMMNECY